MMTLSIGDLKAGMKLARPAVNAQGDILLKEGAVLSSRHISLFKMWGVSRVVVEDSRKTSPVIQSDRDGLTAGEGNSSADLASYTLDRASHLPTVPAQAGADTPDTKQSIPIEVLEEELRKRFQGTIEDNEVMQEIFRVARDRLIVSRNSPEESRARTNYEKE